MMKKGFLKISVGVSLIAGVFACAPAPQKIVKPVVYPSKGPSKVDVNLRLTGDQKIVGLDYSEEVDAAQVFYLSEGVLSLNRALSDKKQAEWANRLLSGLPQNRKSLADSDYAELVIGRAQGSARKTIAEVLPKIKAIPAQIGKIAQSIPVRGVSANPAQLEDSLRAIFRYLRSFDAGVARAGFMPEVYDGVHAQLLKNINLESAAQNSIRKLAKASTLKSALAAVQEAVDKLDLPLPPDKREQLAKGRQLADSIAIIQEPRQALAALVDVWNYLKPEDRRAQIAAVSTDLYDYLNGLSADELECLRRADCMNLKELLAKTLVIQPKIEAFGVGKIKQQLDTKAAQSVRVIVAQVLADQAKDLPQIINQKIAVGIAEKLKPVERLQNQFGEEFRSRLRSWSSKKFESRVPGVLVPVFQRAVVSTENDGDVKVKWIDRKSSAIEDQAAFSALAPKLWTQSDLDKEKVRALVLSQINDLARDYRLRVNRVNDAPALKARVYAESLRAYARLALAFDSGAAVRVDQVLGGATAKDLFPEFDSASLNQSLFPVDAFYALSFHGVSALMGSLTNNKSQLFTVNTDNNLGWLGNGESNDGPMEVMAGISDRTFGGHLAATAKSEDAARLLLAVCDVNEAADTAEQIHSGIMMEPDATGVSPRDQLMQAREKIRLLIVGLANYLSHQFRSDVGLIRHELRLSDQESTLTPFYLLDQALTARALVRASQEIKNDIYAWEAADIVLSMNEHLYNPTSGFYSAPGEKKITPILLIETLRALQAVAPSLSGPSRDQLERLQRPWLDKIAGWQISN